MLPGGEMADMPAHDRGTRPISTAQAARQESAAEPSNGTTWTG